MCRRCVCFLLGTLVFFVYGSCFRSCSKHISRAAAAAAVHVPSLCSFACELPGLDHLSQLSEITALVFALQMFHGNLTIYSDCSTVVKGLTSSSMIVSILSTYRLGTILTYGLRFVDMLRLSSGFGDCSVQVSAHGRDRGQDP